MPLRILRTQYLIVVPQKCHYGLDSKVILGILGILGTQYLIIPDQQESTQIKWWMRLKTYPPYGSTGKYANNRIIGVRVQ